MVDRILSFNLFLTGNEIGASGASQISESLKLNSTLKGCPGLQLQLTFNLVESGKRRK